MAEFNPNSPPVHIVLINHTTGEPYAPSGITPVSDSKYSSGKAACAVLIDPATKQPYTMDN